MTVGVPRILQASGAVGKQASASGFESRRCHLIAHPAQPAPQRVCGTLDRETEGSGTGNR